MGVPFIRVMLAEKSFAIHVLKNMIVNNGYAQTASKSTTQVYGAKRMEFQRGEVRE